MVFQKIYWWLKSHWLMLRIHIFQPDLHGVFKVPLFWTGHANFSSTSQVEHGEDVPMKSSFQQQNINCVGWKQLGWWLFFGISSQSLKSPLCIYGFIPICAEVPIVSKCPSLSWWNSCLVTDSWWHLSNTWVLSHFSLSFYCTARLQDFPLFFDCDKTQYID